MKNTRKYAPRMITEEREAMKSCRSECEINKHFNCACHIQSTLFPATCANKDCRYCFLERERNTALELAKMGITINVSDGNVTINININGKEAK